MRDGTCAGFATIGRNSPRVRRASVLLVALASPAVAGPPGRCQTHHEPTLNRLMTLCDNGTRAVSSRDGNRTR